MKRALAGAVLVAALVLAGCASGRSVSSDDESVDYSTGTSSASIPADLDEYIFTASNGVETTCFTWQKWDFMTESMSSGLSCFPTPGQ